MSINSAMQAGVSGLIANSSALAAISENISNVNTVAYKRSQTNFEAVVTAQIPGQYSAGGTEALTRQLVGQQGLIQAASSNTDLAINGDGFFVGTYKGMGLTNTDERVFTRSGSFSVDANGYLVNDTGLYLQGWPASATGTFSPNPSDLTQMGPINVKSLGAAVAPTTTATSNATLNSQTPVSAAATIIPPAVAPAYSATSGPSMADYANQVANNLAITGTKPDFTMEIKVFDSTGGSHKLAMSFLKNSAANTWNAEIYAVPASDVSVAAGTPPGLIASGLVKFNSNGSINLAGSTLFGGSTNPSISINASSPGTAPAWAAGFGVASQMINFDLTNFTQIAATSALNSVNTDGASAGNLSSIAVDSSGVVSAIFDNNQIRKIAQIGIATFPNPDGLQAISGGAYEATMNAGDMVIKQAGIGGAGKIAPNSLEASTVDLSSEFTGLITTQRAYSASSKIITTADQMLDELIQMKR